MWDGRNVKTRLGAIGASSPVLGLRPTRAVLSLKLNVPNEEIFTGWLSYGIGVGIKLDKLLNKAEPKE